MTPLLNLLQQRSPLPFDDYMQFALYHPDYGYYQRHLPFGAQGDFITAPTLTAHFSKALGRFLLPYLADHRLIELGPGNGQLAYDLLLFLDEQKALPQTYYLVETSTFLQKQQEALFHHLPQHLQDRIVWTTLSELQNLKAIVIANEFLDALPVVRFKMTAAGLQEIYIDAREGTLQEILHEARPELHAFYEHLSLPLAEGYTSEVCLHYPHIAQELKQALRQGVLIFIDYGYTEADYYHPLRERGTLQAYAQHQAIEGWGPPGEVDLTAHVNFSYWGRCLMAEGFQFEYLSPQHVFLMQQGIQEALAQAPIEEQAKIKRLLDPRLMGELFKVMVCSKNEGPFSPPPYTLNRFL